MRSLGIKRRVDAGFSTTELVTILAAVSIGAVAALSVSLRNVALESENEKSAAAAAVMRRILDDIDATPFGDVFRTFNAEPKDDPKGPRTAPGGNIALEVWRRRDTGWEMRPIRRDEAPPPGVNPVRFDVTITFPVHAGGGLAEGDAEFMTGAPVDLDRDGTTYGSDALDTRHDILPVRIEVSWPVAEGCERFEVFRVLSRT